MVYKTSKNNSCIHHLSHDKYNRRLPLLPLEIESESDVYQTAILAREKAITENKELGIKKRERGGKKKPITDLQNNNRDTQKQDQSPREDANQHAGHETRHAASRELLHELGIQLLFLSCGRGDGDDGRDAIETDA